MANNLRKIRMEQGLSQVELAEKSGVTRQTIIKIESDNPPPIKTPTLVKLADALNCSVADVFFD